jgi:signal transduction histidine kinase
MIDSSVASEPTGTTRISIGRIRNIIVIVLTASVLAFTGGVFLLVERIFDNFGPRVREDLIWKTVRGAQELGRASDLGFAMADGEAIREAFGDYRSSKDVLAIVAWSPQGVVLATHGVSPEPAAALFQGPAGRLRETPGYFVSWAGSFIEQSQVGRVAVVVGTGRLVESRSLLRRVQLATGGAALLAWLGGLWFVSFFARAIAKRDAQLARYAATLENKVAERTVELGQRNRGMRLVLDNVSQGFITVDRQGVMEPERSSIVDRWLGEPAPGQLFADYLGRVDARAAAWFGLNLEAIRDDELPLEVILDQMPKQLVIERRTMMMDYIPITDGQTLQKLLIVMSDVTAELAREQLEREQRELAHLFHSIRTDRNGFVEFFEEAEQLVSKIAHEETLGPLVEKRLVHTLKGTSSLFQLRSVVEVCHRVESRMAENGEGLTKEDRLGVERTWDRVAHHARELLGDEQPNSLDLSGEDYARIRSLVEGEASHRQLAAVLESWKLEPIALRLARLGKEGQRLAERLAKPALEVVIDSDDIRLAPGRFAAFFSNLTHVVRNAVDHGIEPPERRRAGGKSAAGKLTFRSRIEGGLLTISVTDDGAGIDWHKVTTKARLADLPHETEEQLTQALFSDGLSTKEDITLVSGRGVGLAAVLSSLTALGGSVRLRSHPGEGTTFEFSLPATDALSAARPVLVVANRELSGLS